MSYNKPTTWGESSLAGRPIPGSQPVDQEWLTTTRLRHYRRNALGDWQPLDKYNCYYNTADYLTLQATINACVAELDARSMAGEYAYGTIFIDEETAQGVTENITINSSQSWGGLLIKANRIGATVYGSFTFNATDAYPYLFFENIRFGGNFSINDLSAGRDWGCSVTFKDSRVFNANVFLNSDSEVLLRSDGSWFTNYTGTNLSTPIIQNAPTSQYPPFFTFIGGGFGSFGGRDFIVAHGSPAAPVFGTYSQIAIDHCQFDRPKSVVRLNGLHRAAMVRDCWYSGNPDQSVTDGALISMGSGAAAGQVIVTGNRKPSGGTSLPIIKGKGAGLIVRNNQLGASGGLLDWSQEAIAGYPIAPSTVISENLLTVSAPVTGSTAPIKIGTPAAPSVVDGVVSGNVVSASGGAVNFLDIPTGNSLVVTGNNTKSPGLATNPPALAANNL